jgi:hypothetical protein
MEADLKRSYFSSELSNLKLGMLAFPMVIKTAPIHMKKNVDAIRLADMGSLLTLSSRRYRITPEINARAKLTTPETSESFCRTPLLLVI